MAGINKASSRYSDTKIKDFYLDIWNTNTVIPASINDELMVIDSKYHERPDKLSYDLYGTPRLWWVFAMRNMDVLFDPINDFKAGVEIFVPSRDRVEEFV